MCKDGIQDSLGFVENEIQQCLVPQSDEKVVGVDFRGEVQKANVSWDTLNREQCVGLK